MQLRRQLHRVGRVGRGGAAEQLRKPQGVNLERELFVGCPRARARRSP
jgi:hypothetical protein